MVSLACRSVTLTLDGQLEASVETGAMLVAKAQEMAGGGLDQPARTQMMRRSLASADWRRKDLTALVHLGRHADASHVVEMLEIFRDQGQRPWNAHIAVSEAYAGRRLEAQMLLDEFLAVGHVSDASTTKLTLYLQVAVLVEHREAAKLISRALSPLSDHALTLIDWTCVARHLGGAAALLGSIEDARSYYDQALRACARIRFRPEIALTRLALAELLLEHYPNERDVAAEHLDFAISEFRDMKMQPALERASRHRELLPA